MSAHGSPSELVAVARWIYELTMRKDVLLSLHSSISTTVRLPAALGGEMDLPLKMFQEVTGEIKSLFFYFLNKNSS